MIRIIARGLAALLLEVATALFTIAILLLVGSAYISARIVGISIRTNRVAAAIKIVRDLLAVGIDSRRKAALKVDE